MLALVVSNLELADEQGEKIIPSGVGHNQVITLLCYSRKQGYD
jgi:hypothetical protein